MAIPTEPIGSIPRPQNLIDGMQAFSRGRMPRHGLDALLDGALRDTILRFEATGSPMITDGEQSKPSFATYPIAGHAGVVAGGVTITFADGHLRQLPKLSAGPFRYAYYADGYVSTAKRYTRLPLKQAVISASALSLLYPHEGVAHYAKEAFIEDLLHEHESDIRRCLGAGASKVQVDFTEGRLAVKLDPTNSLLRSFIELNNRVLERFSAHERRRIGIHTCPGGDHDSTHSADVDYAALLPQLFDLKAGSFYIQLASERDRVRVLKIIARESRSDQMIYVGVTDPIDPRVETQQEVCERVREAAAYIPHARLGTTDDCGFSPFGDDTSTSRDTAFAKIRARVAGTALASALLRA